MFDWSAYTGNLTWLRERTVFLAVTGSHSYGTALPTSDTDLRGVCIAPREYYHGYAQQFAQAVQNAPDLTVFELRKFLQLAADCNPNVVEILYTDPEHHLVVSPLGRRLLEHRHLFLSQRALHTFSGYAVSQLKRIKLHRNYVLYPPTHKPTREEFKLPECTAIPKDQLEAALAAVQKRTDEWAWRTMESLDPALRQQVQDEFDRRLVEITQWGWEKVEDKTWEAAAKGLGFETDFMEVIQRERAYRAAKREWDNYQNWRATRNETRAELEAHYGFDSKHAMHLVRLLRMAREILTTGQVIVKRPDAAELLGIRNGAWSYEQLVEWAEEQDRELHALPREKCPLRHHPDVKAIDRLCRELVEASW